MTRIVVGVDGSPNAEAAVQWALGEALAREGELRLVRAWQDPYRWTDPEVIREVHGDLLAQEESELDVVADHLQAELRRPVDRAVGRGAASEVLRTEAEAADLLVLGTRGLGGFAGVLLGSVATQLSQHAPCPLVLVPLPGE